MKLHCKLYVISLSMHTSKMNTSMSAMFMNKSAYM